MAYITFVSVYLSPNLTVRDFDDRLVELEETLFPAPPPPRRATTINVPADAIPPFTEEELIAVTKSLKKGKAPGPNGILAEVPQVIAL